MINEEMIICDDLNPVSITKEQITQAMTRMTKQRAIITLRCLHLLAEDQEAKEAILIAIKALKEKTRKTAKWVFGTTMNRGWMKCSNCCVSQTPCGTFSYCPNCGARMEGEE